MSFSSDLKEELSKINNLSNKEMVKAEFVGYLLSKNVEVKSGKIKYATENQYNINRLNKILNNLNINYNIQIQGKVYIITFKRIKIGELEYVDNLLQINKDVFAKIEKRKSEIYKAIVRGAFLGGGSLNNPDNKYHLEILFSTKQNAQYIMKILQEFEIQCKTLNRKNSFSIYIKEAEEISKFLALIGANKAVLNFEEIRVVRDTRNNLNRLINCETANLNKTINAALVQINAIEYLKKIKVFDDLPENLKEVAQVRVKNPDISLVELGQNLKKPLGKSGVNHRLKKICEIAEEEKLKRNN